MNKKQCSRQLQFEVSCAGNVVDSSLSSLSSPQGGVHWGEGRGGGWGEGRGHFIHLAIHCTPTWSFALKGLRTTKQLRNPGGKKLRTFLPQSDIRTSAWKEAFSEGSLWRRKRLVRHGRVEQQLDMLVSGAGEEALMKHSAEREIGCLPSDVPRQDDSLQQPGVNPGSGPGGEGAIPWEEDRLQPRIIQRGKMKLLCAEGEATENVAQCTPCLNALGPWICSEGDAGCRSVLASV